MSDHATPPVIGIIGGSGLYEIEGLENARWEAVKTPFGEPSDEILHGTLGGVELAFLPRHGRGHRIPPSDLNYRANIDALKRLGCTEIISLSACGSLKADYPPGTFVIVDQFIDRTFARNKSFFGEGLVAHVGFGHPVCSRLGDALAEGLAQLDIPHARGGTYLVMEGPQFSTIAESNLYRSWGCDVIGMTNMPEAKLAREAECVTRPLPWSLTLTAGIRTMITSRSKRSLPFWSGMQTMAARWSRMWCRAFPVGQRFATTVATRRLNTPSLRIRMPATLVSLPCSTRLPAGCSRRGYP